MKDPVCYANVYVRIREPVYNVCLPCRDNDVYLAQRMQILVHLHIHSTNQCIIAIITFPLLLQL